MGLLPRNRISRARVTLGGRKGAIVTKQSYDPAYGLVATLSELSGRRLRASEVVAAVIDTATNTVIGLITVGSQPRGIAVVA